MKLKLDMTLEQQRTKLKKYQTAGQPKKKNKKVSITIRIKPELLARITGNRSYFIEQAIIENLEKNNDKKHC